jgi:ribose transport system substrate-binding protein
VARAAAAAGIGWAVLNRSLEYVSVLRSTYHAPMFCVAADNEEVGRIQGRQFAALLPQGGTVLYLQGPAETSTAKLRTSGMYETKPANVEVKVMRAQWTEASAFKAIQAWLRLSTSQQSRIDVIAAQNDAMAVGAKKAFQELADYDSRAHWLGLPYLGCDGVPKTGQAWVRNGLLAATVITPPLAGQALEMMAQACKGSSMPPELTLVPPRSFPALESLAAADKRKLSARHASGS